MDKFINLMILIFIFSVLILSFFSLVEIVQIVLNVR
jgi:hypothetical protein